MVQNGQMKNVVYCCLGVVFLSCIALAALLLHGPKDKETWSTLTAVLAVLAAAIAVLPALRVLEIQEDSQRPRPTPYFDVTSRYDMLQLRVKNLGASAAYDVQLIWKMRPVDHKGNEVRCLDRIAVLVPQDTVSTLIGTAHDTVPRLSDSRFEGECHFKDASGKKLRQKFICSVDANQHQLIHDSELPKTLWELQKIPREISRVTTQLEKLTPRS